MNGSSSGAPHRLAIVSLSSSLLAYASSFVGSPTLIWPALLAALIAIVCGHLALRTIRAEPARHTGKAIAAAGLASGYAYLALGVALLWLMAGSAATG